MKGSSLSAKPRKTLKQQDFRNWSAELSRLVLVKISIKLTRTLKLTKRNKREKNWRTREFKMSMHVRRNIESSSRRTVKLSASVKSKILEKR